MKKILTLVLLAGLAVPLWADDKPTKENVKERIDMASTVVKEISAAPDKGIPEEVIDNAKCIAVVPHLVKGGFIFGGKFGRGVATCRTASGWTAPAFFTVGGGSWGAQIGIEGVDLVMTIMNDKGMNMLLKDKFELSGEASAAAGPVGRHASAATDWTAGPGILTYSRSKGLFAGISLEGAVIHQDDDSTGAVYGNHGTAFYQKILAGEVKTPEIAEPFLAAIR